MEFNPFAKKKLADLREADLELLRGVSEGWYVEYKREMSKAEAIAKSVAAMANTYGGWICYGVAEKSKDEPVAGAFPGIPIVDLDAQLMRLRGAVAQCLNPAPHFDVQIVRADRVGLLDEDHAVVIVHVPRSVNTPHLHKSGVIYRRVGDSSEPAAENDRSRLDDLFRRREKLEQHYADLFADALTVPDDQFNHPMLRLMLVTDLYGDRGVRLSQFVEKIREVMGRPTRDVSAMPFDTVHDSVTGFTARQLRHNRPDLIAPTWELRRDLTSVITLPLRVGRAWAPGDVGDFLKGYQGAKAFWDALVRDGHERPTVLDLNSLSAVLMGIAHIQHELMELAGADGKIWFKAELVNAEGCVPFLDSRIYLKELERHAVPMCLRKRLEVPSGKGLNTFFESFSNEGLTDERPIFRVANIAWPIFIHLARALGLPTGIREDNENVAAYFDELRQASARFTEVQASARQRQLS